MKKIGFVLSLLTAVTIFTGCGNNASNIPTPHANLVVNSISSVDPNYSIDDWTNKKDCYWINSSDDRWNEDMFGQYDAVGISSEPDSEGNPILRASISKINLTNTFGDVKSYMFNHYSQGTIDKSVVGFLVDKGNWRLDNSIDPENANFDTNRYLLEILQLDEKDLVMHNVTACFDYTDASYGFGNINVDGLALASDHFCNLYDARFFELSKKPEIKGNVISRHKNASKGDICITLLVDYNEERYNVKSYIANNKDDTITLITYAALPVHLDKVATENIDEVYVYRFDTYKFIDNDRGYSYVESYFYKEDEIDDIITWDKINVTHNDIVVEESTETTTEVTTVDEVIVTSESEENVTTTESEEDIITTTAETTTSETTITTTNIEFVDPHEYCIDFYEGIRLGYIEENVKYPMSIS